LVSGAGAASGSIDRVGRGTRPMALTSCGEAPPRKPGGAERMGEHPARYDPCV